MEVVQRVIPMHWGAYGTVINSRIPELLVAARSAARWLLV